MHDVRCRIVARSDVGSTLVMTIMTDR